MNELIEALMIKASNGSCYDGPREEQLFGDDIKKFAELIVKECVEQGKQVQLQTVSNASEDYNSGRVMGIEVYMNKIKHKFGIQE